MLNSTWKWYAWWSYCLWIPRKALALQNCRKSYSGCFRMRSKTLTPKLHLSWAKACWIRCLPDCPRKFSKHSTHGLAAVGEMRGVLGVDAMLFRWLKMRLPPDRRHEFQTVFQRLRTWSSERRAMTAMNEWPENSYASGNGHAHGHGAADNITDQTCPLGLTMKCVNSHTKEEGRGGLAPC